MQAMPLYMIPAVLLLSGLSNAFRIVKVDKSVAVSADSSNSSGPDISIVNGRDARQGDFPWQVQLSDRRGHFCGGTLIHARWVLTAAHCLEGESTSSFNSTAGQHDVRRQSGNEQTSRIRRIHNHPRYNSRTTDNDIALLQLDSAMRMTNFVGTARLPRGDISPGTTCKISGWGATSESGRGANILQEGDVRVMSNRDCQNTGYSSSQITAGMLCAQGTRNGRIVDACQGDSGGPLTCGSTVHGATSWGRGCARRDYPGVWARVAHYRSWIDGIMR